MKRQFARVHSFGYLKVLLIGLLVAQAVATLQVRRSNLALYAKIKAVQDAGFTGVPAGPALESLKAAGSAIWGGLFFTLSIGAILTLASMAASRLSRSAGSEKNLHLYAPVVIWAFLVILINLSGFDLYVNLYFWLIPPIVFFSSRRWLPAAVDWRDAAVQLLPVVILAALWFTQFDQHMFIDIRDRLLLSNPVGERINRFYYHYTLYPAEAFKAPSQKSINTSRIDDTVEKTLQRSLARALTRIDWLPVTSERSPDLVLRQNQGRLEMVQAGRVITESSVGELLSQPGAVLERFSVKADRHSLFRLFSFYGLLFGFPILLYIGLFALTRALCGLLVNQRRSALLASAACLLLGIIIWGYFQYGRVDATAAQDFAPSLASKNWRTKVAALRQFRSMGLDVMQIPEYDSLKKSTQVPVRYWLVEALGTSKNPNAFNDLSLFLDDPSLNVRTRACQVLGLSKDQRAVPILVERLNRSDEWYFQWYAYKAMKVLGWNQAKSD